MRILAIYPTWPWPARSGADQRAANLLERLALSDDLETLFLQGPPTCGSQGSPSPAGPARVLPFRFAAWPGLLAAWRDPAPDTIRHWSCDETLAAVRRHARERGPWDIVLVQDLPLLPYGRAASEASGGAPVILDRTRVDGAYQEEEGPRRLAGQPARRLLGHRLRCARLLAWERAAAETVALQVVCAASDASWIMRHARSAAPPLVVPNGIDTRHRTPRPASEVEAGTIVFTGCLDYFPNADAVRWLAGEIWPRIAHREPHARLLIGGRNPPEALVREAQAGGAQVLPDVPDIDELLGRAAVVVAPVRIGGGTRLKIVEAWAARRPVGATTRAADGLDARSGHDALIEDSASGFAEAAARLLRSERMRERLAGAGRLRVEREFGWDTLFARWHDGILAAERGGLSAGRGSAP